MGQLEGKVAAITGASSGIGAATAHLFSREGAKVAIFARRVEPLDELVREIGADKALAVTGDVANLDDLDRFFALTAERFGKIDVLFANAGINNTLATVTYMPVEDFDRVFAVNVRGTYFTVQKAVPHLNNPASVILTSSVAHNRGWAMNTVYAASKSAIRCFARGMSAELADRGIRVNVLSPGPTDTAVLSGEGLPEEASRKMREAILADIPAGRIADPEELARAALFLAGEGSSYMYGSELSVDDGLVQL